MTDGPTIEGLLRELDTARAKLAALEADRDSTPQRDSLDPWRLKHARAHESSLVGYICAIRDAIGITGAFDELPAKAGAVSGALRAATHELADARASLARAVVARDAAAAEHDEALAEVDRLRAELAKPVASPWASSGAESDRVALRRCVIADGGAVRSDYAAARVCSVTPIGWTVSALTEGVLGRQDKVIVASGPETGDEGRRLADAAAAAAGWRLL